MERKNYKISQKVFEFPYNGNFEKNDNEMFSEKFCCCTIKIRKKIIKGIKWSIFYLEVSLSVANVVIRSQAIGLPIPPQTPAIMRSIHSNADLSKQAIIAQVIQQMPAEIDFTQKEMNELKRNNYIKPTFKLISSSEKMKETTQLTPLLL